MVAEAWRRDFWQDHVDAWWESGRTQRAYCQEHGLCEAQFSHWKGRLRKGSRCRGVETQLVPVSVIEELAPRTGRVEGHAQSQAADRQADLTLVFSNGSRLEIGEGFDSGVLRRVLEVLGDVG